MLAQSMQMESEASKPSFRLRTRGSGPLASLKKDLMQVSRNPKQRKNQCRVWNFQFTLHSPIFCALKALQHMKKLICLQITSKLDWVIRRPHSVHSVTVSCNFKRVLVPLPDVSSLILVPVYFQTQDTSIPEQHISRDDPMAC